MHLLTLDDCLWHSGCANAYDLQQSMLLISSSCRQIWKYQIYKQCVCVPNLTFNSASSVNSQENATIF